MDNKLLKSCFAGIMVAFGMSAILLCVFGYICYTRNDPDSLIPILATVTLFVSAFAGGYIAARRMGQSGLLCGLISGGIFVGVIILLSLVLRDESSRLSFGNILAFLSVLGVSLVGGYFGVPNGKKRKKHKR